MRQPPPFVRSAAVLCAALAAAGLLNSCAVPQPFRPDANATAPVLPGYGRITTGVRARTPEAQHLFEQGMLQAYAFNAPEAVRMFKAALARDPACVMCAWGVAWQLGPNINDHDRDKVPEALRYVDYALQGVQNAPRRERDLVEALALRYAHASQARETAPLLGERCGKGAEADEIHPLNRAYAERMRALADRYPQDPDVLSLHAEAEIIATPGDAPWDEAGKPAGRIGEVADRLERLLPLYPDHTGIHHYMVHVVDARAVAHRGVAAADRLGAIAPASPHLLHMPGHIYTWVGRFGDAVRVNQLALAADEALAAQLKTQGFSGSMDWRGHNGQFYWYAAVMDGQETTALDAARQMTEAMGARKDGFAEYVRSLPLLTLLRFGRWEQVLALPAPVGDVGIARAFWEHGRGVAQARLGRLADAKTTLADLRATVAKVRGDKPASVPKRRLAIVDYALAGLEAELALAEGDAAQAVAKQKLAAKSADVLDNSEPPWLANANVLGVADIHARARQWTEAEAAYQRSLQQRPGNVWARRGLEQLQAARARG